MEDRWRSHSSQTTHRRAEYWDEMKKRKKGEKKRRREEAKESRETKAKRNRWGFTRKKVL